VLDRRTYPRFAVPCPVRFQVELLGSQFLVEHFDAGGTMVNISRRGMLAEVDRLLAVGTDCTVSLVQVEDLVRPRQMRGHVRRSSLGRGGGWEIGIEFESLVDILPGAVSLSAPYEARLA